MVCIFSGSCSKYVYGLRGHINKMCSESRRTTPLVTFNERLWGEDSLIHKNILLTGQKILIRCATVNYLEGRLGMEPNLIYKQFIVWKQDAKVDWESAIISLKLNSPESGRSYQNMRSQRSLRHQFGFAIHYLWYWCRFHENYSHFKATVTIIELFKPLQNSV